MPDSLGSPRPQHRPAIASSLVDEYREHGFVTVPAILDTALVAALQRATERLWEAGRNLTEKTRHYDLSAGHCADSPRIRRVSSPTELDPIFEQAAFDSVLGDIAADLIGGPVKFYHSKINFKLPGGGEEIGWHQDWPVFPHTNANLVALSVPLTPSRKANGCLRTIPGSHRGGARSHWADGRYVLNCNQSMSAGELATAEDSEVDPGDVVAHHGLVVHGSAPNPSPDIRTTWIIQYAAADAFAYTAPVIDSRHRNRMVRGEPATHARVEAGFIELPPDFSGGYSSIYSLQTRKAG